jgi:hypothetical protein
LIPDIYFNLGGDAGELSKRRIVGLGADLRDVCEVPNNFLIPGGIEIFINHSRFMTASRPSKYGTSTTVAGDAERNAYAMTKYGSEVPPGSSAASETPDTLKISTCPVTLKLITKIA